MKNDCGRQSVILESVHGMYVKQCVLKLSVKVTLACCFLFLLFYLLSIDE